MKELIRAEPILLFFYLFFFPAILLFLIHFSQYFAQEYSILLSIYKYLLLNVKHLSMCDCSVRVFYNMVTALLGYLDLSVLSLGAWIDLMLFVAVLLEHFDFSHAKYTKFQSFSIHFTKISPFLAFCSLLLPSYFSKKIFW